MKKDNGQRTTHILQMNETQSAINQNTHPHNTQNSRQLSAVCACGGGGYLFISSILKPAQTLRNVARDEDDYEECVDELWYGVILACFKLLPLLYGVRKPMKQSFWICPPSDIRNVQGTSTPRWRSARILSCWDTQHFINISIGSKSTRDNSVV